MARVESEGLCKISAETTTRTKFLQSKERHFDYEQEIAIDSRLASSSDPYLAPLNLARSTLIYLYDGSKRWILQKLFRGYAVFGQIAERFVHNR